MKQAGLLGKLSLLFAVGLLSGCGGELDSRLTGKWKLAQPELLAGKVGQDLATEAAELSAETPPMVIEFGAHGSLRTATRMGGIQSDKTGTWEVKSVGPPLVIAFVLAGTAAETEIEWNGEDQIKMVPPNMAGLTMKLVFQRSTD